MIRLLVPLGGAWTFEGLPPVVTLCGRRFARARWAYAIPGVRAQYRETVPRRSAHLYIKGDAWLVNHLDDYNPDAGFPLEHFAADVLGVL